MAQGRYEEALREIDTAMGCPGVDQETRLRAAEMCLACKKVDAALVEVDRVIDGDPKSADAWALRGRIMHASGNPKQCWPICNERSSIPPNVATCSKRRRTSISNSASRTKPWRRCKNSATPTARAKNRRRCLRRKAISTRRWGVRRMRRSNIDWPRRAASVLRNPTILASWAEAEAAAGNMTAAHEAAQQALAAAPDDPRSQALVQRTAAAVAPTGATYRR
ncbi:MAG: tetratricopeptide repeat protein [Pirellulales bacterium]